MKLLRTGFGTFAATIAVAAMPAMAAAEYLVPPGNSAATQYTEALPTSGGDRSTGNGKKAKHPTPAQTLGAQKVRKLDAQGPEGRAVAEFVAETAPPVAATATTDAAPAGGGGGKAEPKHSTGGAQRPPNASQPQANPEPAIPSPSGSSGFGEVAAEATGFSTGQMGALLPLIILATIAWSVAFLLRQRKRPTT